jgi:hypothetical protein
VIIPVTPPPAIGVPDVHVEVAVQPVVIDVDLGARLFGAIGVRLDPRLLPIDRLRGAGWIEVELTGPAGDLASFQAQLSTTLARDGVRVDGWATAATDASVIHARFTIWPPGTRPLRP